MPAQINELRKIASASGVEIIEAPFASVEELKADLEEKERKSDIEFDAICQVAEPFAAMDITVGMLAKFATLHKIPYSSGTLLKGEFNPLFINVPDNYEVGELAAQQAHKILSGTPAGSLPVISPESNLTINLKVADQTGIAIPKGLLIIADKIIR